MVPPADTSAVAVLACSIEPRPPGLSIRIPT